MKSNYSLTNMALNLELNLSKIIEGHYILVGCKRNSIF